MNYDHPLTQVVLNITPPADAGGSDKKHYATR
jgi:hypothetical protein